MYDPQTTSVLSDLLQAEYSNLVSRLGECAPIVNWPSAEDYLVVERMLADAKRHERELAEEIIRLRGPLPPPTLTTSSGGLHFLRLDYLMPQVIAGVRRLISTYEVAGGRIKDPQSSKLIVQILADHRRHLMELEKLHGKISQPV